MYGKMERDTKESGWMANFMEKELKLYPMALFSMESGLKGGQVEQACASTLMELSTLGLG